MKKIKIFTLILVLALGMIGGAYALWTDEVKAVGTVNTGELDVVIDGCTVSNIGHETMPYITGSASFTDKEATFEVHNLYPTAKNVYQNINLRIKNNSNIPVSLESVDFSRNTGPAWGFFKGEVHRRLYDENNVLILGSYLNTGEFLWINNGIEDALESAMAGVVLLPGETVRFGSDEGENSILYWLDEAAGNNTQNQTLSFTITFNWKQWNLP